MKDKLEAGLEVLKSVNVCSWSYLLITVRSFTLNSYAWKNKLKIPMNADKGTKR